MLEMPSRLGEEKEIYVALLWNDSQRMGEARSFVLTS